MSEYWIRAATADDTDEISSLNIKAFGRTSEAAIVRRLAVDGDSLASLVAHDDGRLVGHIQFFRILVDSMDTAAGLGPMSVLPSLQRRGIGSGLVNIGMRLMEGMNRASVFVLGHPEYYPRFGFEASAAEPYEAPWSGEAFMARHFDGGRSGGGKLRYPSAFRD